MTSTDLLESAGPTPGDRSDSMRRMLEPRSIAVVGVSENSQYISGIRHTAEQSDAELVFVHPKGGTILGRPVYPDVASIGRPVDVVFTAVSAARTLPVVEQAAAIGAGGVITIAAGFAELGAEGIALQRRIREISLEADMRMIGPNGVGLINVPKRLELTMLADFPRHAGGLSMVTHSGAMIYAAAASANRVGGVGFNLLVSAGNEAVSDIADFLDYFVDDPGTKVIALAFEKIRRPREFFAAAARALQAGKPIVAIKMGRSARGQRMAASHTGTLTSDDGWTYEVALRQAGIQFAYDLDDLIDRVQFLEQLPQERWTPVRGLAVLTLTGGFAQLSSDLAEDLAIDVPESAALQPFISENIPGAPVTNPLDATAFLNAKPGLWAEIVRRYLDEPGYDAYLYTSQHADWDGGAVGMADVFCHAASTTTKPMAIAPLAGLPGQWMWPYREIDVAVGNGLRGCLLGFKAMAQFMRTRRDRAVAPADTMPEVARPTAPTIAVAEGSMLPFGATMEMLSAAGIPVARYHLIGAGEEITPPPFAGPWVVKLSDVAHRTEHDAVRVNVAEHQLDAAVAELRAIAAADRLPAEVAVQEMVRGTGEAFIGIQGAAELGPLVVFGLGGVFVETLKRVGGRFAPFTEQDATELLDEFADTGVLEGHRGRPAWPRAELVKVLGAASALAAGGHRWIESVDINPLIVTEDGLVAVDGLCLVGQVTN